MCCVEKPWNGPGVEGNPFPVLGCRLGFLDEFPGTLFYPGDEFSYGFFHKAGGVVEVIDTLTALCGSLSTVHSLIPMRVHPKRN